MVLKARVNPSQRSPDDAREIATSVGDIVSTHCTCMAGFVADLLNT